MCPVGQNLNLKKKFEKERKEAKVKAFSFSFSFISEATTMKAASTMPRHGGARNKAGYPKKSEQLVHRFFTIVTHIIRHQFNSLVSDSIGRNTHNKASV
jgi:hypothetical protein